MTTEYNRILAKITGARLSIKERGILTFHINVDYDEWGSQTIGGYALDGYDRERNERIGSAYGCEMIRRLLLFFDVDDFSEMADKYVYVLGEGDGFSFKPVGFKSFRLDSGKDEELIFSEVATYMIGDKMRSDEGVTNNQ